MVDPSTQNILVSVKSRYIVDTILALPAIRAMRKQFPNANITLFSGPWAGEILRDCPYIDDYLFRSPSHQRKNDLEMINIMSKRKFTTAALFNRSFSSGLLAWMVGIPERVGFDTEMRGHLLTNRVPYDHEKHEIDNLLQIAVSCGVDNPEYLTRNTELWIHPNESEHLREWLMHDGWDGTSPLMVLQPDSQDAPTKRWDTEKYIEVAKKLRDKVGYQIVLIGREGEYECSKYMQQQLGADTINFVTQIRLRETLALLHQSDLLLGCDSGLMHAAIATRTPTLSIFAPHRVKQYGYNKAVNRLVCHELPADQPVSESAITESLQSITVDEVLEVADSLIDVWKESYVPGTPHN